MWHDGDWGTWDWTAMTLLMLLFWGGLIALVVWLLRVGGGRRGVDEIPPPATPDEVLAERFARGRSTRTSSPAAVRCCTAPARRCDDRATRGT
jgi:putative membrane protein